MEQKVHTIANPLSAPVFPIAFSEVKANEVEPTVLALIKEVEQKVQNVASVAAPTYESVLMELDRVTEPLDFAMSVVRHLEGVVTTPELREAHNAVQGPVSQFYTSIPLNEKLWQAIRRVHGSDEVNTLAPVHRRNLEKTVTGFRRAGADLDAEGKAKLEAIDIDLTKITTKFSQNVLDATNAFELVVADEAQLSGLPDSARTAARESAKTKGKEGWRFTLQGPSYIAAMTYLDDRAIRHHLWQASNSRATQDTLDNRPLLGRILELRREKAKLLGYRDFADLVLDERMAHTGERAQAFISDLQHKTQAFYELENANQLKMAQQLGYERVEPWDISYLAEKERKHLYDFDEEELRPYFQLDRVTAGMFTLFGGVLGIEVKVDPTVEGWDPAVQYYRVQDAASGAFLGGFYTDWFPRENKRGGAWMDSLITGNPDEGRPHVGLMCGNLTPPAGDKPALLTHREVETVFHEFGHLLHHLLSRVPVRGLAGTNVPWDFVELPSQIMENWCMERQALDLFARHYQTGETIPQELFDKMYRARTFRSANMQMRQLGFGMVDLKLHREFDPKSGADVMAFAREILAQFTPAPLPPHYAMIASFTHLFSSPVAYGAGYYSYKWAEVLDADAFSRFRREGIFNSKTGADYRREILEKGDSMDPAQLYRRFMGRDPDANALMERLGLHKAA